MRKKNQPELYWQSIDQFKSHNEVPRLTRNDVQVLLSILVQCLSFFIPVYEYLPLRSTLLEARFIHNGASQISSIRTSPRIPVIISTSLRICSQQSHLHGINTGNLVGFVCLYYNRRRHHWSPLAECIRNMVLEFLSCYYRRGKGFKGWIKSLVFAINLPD